MLSSKERQRRYRLRNAEKLKAKNKLWRETHPEYQQQWLRENPNYQQDYQKHYREANAEKLREYQVNYRKL